MRCTNLTRRPRRQVPSLTSSYSSFCGPAYWKDRSAEAVNNLTVLEASAAEAVSNLTVPEASDKRVHCCITIAASRPSDCKNF